MNLQERIEKMEKELAELKADVAAQVVEWPLGGDRYWTIAEHGKILSYLFCDDKFHHDFLEFGNIFRTEEEARREVERRKVLTQLRKLARESWDGGKADWKNARQDKWYLFFDHQDGIWNIAKYTVVQDQGSVYFATREAAHAAVKTIEADRMLLLLEDWTTSMKGNENVR